MNNLSAIIVDDESLARRGLALRLQQIPGVDVVSECANGREALEAIAAHSPDLVFLDIQMPGMDGFDVVRKLQAGQMPMIIFVTAFDQYAVEAFKVHAVDYVLKPIDDDRLHEAIDRAVAHHSQEESERTKQRLMELMMGLTGASASSIEEMAQAQRGLPQWPDKLVIKDGADIHLVKIDDIHWIDAAGDYMCVHADGETHIMRITMKQLEAMLNPARFLRVHRSTLVNTDYISGAQTLGNGEYMLSLEGGAQLKVSRGYRARVRELLAG
ncbi:response regulator transcription factor [Pseudohalioglobus sediminis]|uniref:Response regulator transcription factor n=1 Tax=Pseudohalioglobus sediminis TaxID=2606449 RepID=A0A5B0X5W9_9GAMM|nr:LytTR family DNA-binding domain-containing protein [Pseudohalioglobus sediminis]KAA1194075.1 response regulator transcription factor [Pseudohalioglobus sediminis]